MRAYIDEVIREGFAVTAAAGNHDQCAQAEVQSPGTAWNVVTVGTIGDQNTTSWWDDDVGDHCWLDPLGGTFKPEISAPGENVVSNGIVPGGQYYTSIATPQVAGTMAQLMQIRPSELVGSPLQVRAILVTASHAHMVQAGSAAGRIDPHEGMGSLTSKWSDVIAARLSAGGIKKGDFGKVSFNATGQDPQSGCWTRNTTPISRYFSVAAGKYVRVAAFWNSNGFYSEGSSFGTNDVYGDYLDANFDIKVYKANGALKGSSAWVAYDIEAVHFTAVAGESPYRLEITPKTWPCSTSQQAVAWAYVSWSTP